LGVNKPQIVNLSDVELTDAQIKLLEKGLKFAPTPNSDRTVLATDIKNFGRKLRLREYFAESEDTNENSSQNEGEGIFRNKGKFNPPRGRDKTLDLAVDSLIHVADNLDYCDNQRSKRSNLSKQEWDAIYTLKNNRSIVIKEADKGGSVVIMNTEYYAEKMKSMLQDSNTYKEITNDDHRKVIKKISSLIDHESNIPKDVCEYLTQFTVKSANIYGLPKIHKCATILQASKSQSTTCIDVLCPEDLTFRPIVAGPLCATHRLSKLIDYLLKPFTRYVKSFIRDDIDFLCKLPCDTQDIGSGHLTTFDAVSLYTNIDKELGISAIKYWLEKFPDTLPDTYSIQFILEAVKLILDNNTFQFDNCNFLQISGTAMGTQMAPTYATLTVGYIEELMYKKLKCEKGDTYALYVEKNWKRFLDDCFIYWPDHLGNVTEFLQILNSMHPKLQFTMNISKTEIPFLDILLLNKDGHIETDIYYKATDSHNYVPFSSCHPHHTKLNIPYSIARRICTIVENDEKCDQRLGEMKVFLQQKGYPLNVINDATHKAKNHNRMDLLTPVPHKKSHKNVLTFVTTYNPNNPNIQKGVDTALAILDSSSKMKSVMKNTKLIKSRRQPPNLKRMLTTAEFSSTARSYAVRKCGDKRCKCCNHIREASTITVETGQQFQVKSNMDCNSANLLYILTCNGCDQQYVGETGDTLRNRIRVHRQQIRDASTRMLRVSEHIDNCAKTEPQFSVFPFYKLPCEDVLYRREKEQYFIRKFKPSLNGQL